MALTKVKPGGIHADLSSAISGSANASAISGSANASAISGSHTSGFEFAGTVSGSSISTGSFSSVVVADKVQGNLSVGGNLTVTGALPTAAKGWVKLQSTDASNSATVDMETGIGSDYDHYMVVGSNIQPVTDGSHIIARLKINGSYQTTNYDNYTIVGTAGNSAHEADANADVGYVLILPSVGDATGETGNFTLYFSDPSDTDNSKVIYWIGGEILSSALGRMGFGTGCCYTGQEVMTGVQFLFNSGNIDRGTFTLYGLSK